MTDPFVTSMIECRALDVSSRRGDELNNMLEVPVVADGENSLREREGPQELEALSNVITQLMEGVTNGQVRLVSLRLLTSYNFKAYGLTCPSLGRSRTKSKRLSHFRSLALF